MQNVLAVELCKGRDFRYHRVQDLGVMILSIDFKAKYHDLTQPKSVSAGRTVILLDLVPDTILDALLETISD